MGEHITIKRKTEGQDLYSQLQEKSLRDVQRLSGEIWTDYNVHDPGVTLLDTLNYALLETDYRLQFDWQDYLTLPEKGFHPEHHALFAPSAIFPVNPVTVTDYRKLFVSNVEDLSGVRVIVHPESGIYDFALEVWPETSENRKKKIVKEVCSLFHSHRNLCENLGEIRFLEYDILYLCTEVEIDETIDEVYLMARLFLTVQEFLKAGARFRRVDELLAEGWMADEILEGPVQRRMVVDEASLDTDWNEYDLALLHQHIKSLPGVKRIVSLGFREGERMLRNTLKRKGNFQGYALSSFGSEKQEIELTRKGKRLSIVKEEVLNKLASLHTALYGAQNRTTDKEILDACPVGKSRNLFGHTPIVRELPACYKKTMNKQFASYLEIFDRAMEEALDELKELPFWMVPDTYGMGDKKEHWMNVLDVMYGEDSNPVFLKKYESDGERRMRRIHFLKDIPLWGLNRGKGMNLQEKSLHNESGVETYLKRLLNTDRYGLEWFVVEHNLLEYQRGQFQNIPETAFEITVVGAMNDEWLVDDEFKQGCEQLLSQRIPAHIRLNVYWQDKMKIAQFRSAYLFWKYSLSTSKKLGLEELCELLKTYLADDNYWYGKV